jgi:hypothetical protein
MKHTKEESWSRRLVERSALWMLTFASVLSLGLGAVTARAAGPADVSGGSYANPAVASDLMSEPFLLGETAGYSLLPQAGQKPLQWTGVPWPANLHISGFINQNTGVWTNPYTLKDWTNSRSNLAFARTWAQIDTNYRLNENNTFFLRTWFTYEPPSDWAAQSTSGRQATSGNQFYNTYQVRDAWWKTRLGPLSIFTGNQIVVWGQSVAFRVGDVINPTDTTWAFGFANLEQSRMAQWMIHPLLDVPDWGPFTSNFLEAVWIPGVQPMWWSNDYYDNRYNGESTIAGRVNSGFPSGISHGGGRFDVHTDYNPNPNNGDIILGPGPHFGNHNVVPAPFGKALVECQPPIGTGTVKCGAILNAVLKGESPIVNAIPWKVPPVTWSNMQEGVRFHTITPDGTELTALYYNTFDTYPVFRWQVGTPNWYGYFEPLQDMGITADRPVPVPASLAEYLPLVARFESVYTNHAPFMDLSFPDLRAVRYSDILNTMLALDIDQAYAPWLTTTGNLTMNLEWNHYIVLDSNSSMYNASPVAGALGAPGAATPGSENTCKDYDLLLLNIGTSYWWDTFEPTWTMIYGNKGNTFLLFPSITLNPPWTKNYFFKVQDVQVLGSDAGSSTGGQFKGENFVSFMFQYNFDLL